MPLSNQNRMPLSRRQLLKGAAALTLGACAPPPTAKTSRAPLPRVPGVDRPNIVVYLADALRADRLGCYGYAKPTSPAMDTFAARAVRYRTCVAQASWTKPSIGSVWTGLPAQVHQAIVSNAAVPRDQIAPRVHVLRRQFPTLAEILAAAGYSTALFLSNPQVQREYGFAQGYGKYRYDFMEDPGAQTAAAISWLRTAGAEPFFLFIHVIDPHAPYLPDAADFEGLHGQNIADARARLGARDLALLGDYDFWYENFPAAGLERPDIWTLSPDGMAHLEALYVAEIPRVDRQFQRLLDALEEDRLLDRTVVVATSDHGEAFYEHGTLQHGMSLYAEELHVPLLIGGPDIQPAVIETPVALSDLYPTLAALAGAPIQPNPWHGPLPGIPGMIPPTERSIHAMTNRFEMDIAQWHYAMYHDGMKIIESKDSRLVFDLQADPGEHFNLMETPRAGERAVGAFLARYEAERTALANAALAYGEAEWTSMSDEDREHLEALGYVN